MYKKLFEGLFKEFLDTNEAKAFGIKYYKSWLREFQVNEEFRGIVNIDEIEYEILKRTKGLEYAEMIKNDSVINNTVQLYTGGNYGLAVNELCRFNYTNFGFEIETLNTMIKVLDNEISKYKIQENIVGYRVLNYEHLMRTQGNAKLKIGDNIVDNGFMGVGLVKDTLLKEFSGRDILLKIYIPAGVNGIYLDLVSNRENEQEVLLERGIKLKIISNKKSYLEKNRIVECVIEK